MSLDHIHQGIPDKRVAPEYLRQGSRNRIRRGFTRTLPKKHLSPPLQSDLAGHQFARKLTHLHNFDIECIKRKQCASLVGGSEQCRKIAIPISVAHAIGAICSSSSQSTVWIS